MRRAAKKREVERISRAVGDPQLGFMVVHLFHILPDAPHFSGLFVHLHSLCLHFASTASAKRLKVPVIRQPGNIRLKK